MRSFGVLLLVTCCICAQCPPDAVFVGLPAEIRGFPLRANGPVPPCQVISIPNALGTSRSLAVSPDGALHTIEFLSGEMVESYGPAANGIAVPMLSVTLGTNDSVGLAVDARGNIFVATMRVGQILVLSRRPPVGGGFPPALTTSCLVGGLAMDADDNLVAIRTPDTGTGVCATPAQPQVMTFATSQTLHSPPLLRAIAGSATGLLGPVGIAVDPSTGELYVYDTDYHSVQVSVFPPRANGNVAPIRTIAGARTSLPIPEMLPNTNKIAVSADGRLFVSAPNGRILVFAPGANGDITPSQIIDDSSAAVAALPQASIAVRSCICQFERFRRRRPL